MPGRRGALVDVQCQKPGSEMKSINTLELCAVGPVVIQLQPMKLQVRTSDEVRQLFVFRMHLDDSSRTESAQRLSPHETERLAERFGR